MTMIDDAPRVPTNTELVRTFSLDEWELRADGRTVEGRIIPYNEVGHVAERTEGGNVLEFDEQFLPGSCAAMAQACEARGNASFVEFRIEHDDNTFDNLIGHARSLYEKDDGAYASFRLYERKDIDLVRSMLKESHNGLSVMFRAVRAPKMIGDIVSHVQVAIRHVAATPMPVYGGARIMSLRDVREQEAQFLTPHLDSINAMLAELRKSPVPNAE